MIYDSCSWSSIVFIILGIILQDKPIFLRLSFILLGVSSTLFHMLDHEIDKDNYIHNYMIYIYMFDMFMITLLSSFILTKSIMFSILIAISGFTNIQVKNTLYCLGLCKLLFTLTQNENHEIMLLYIIIMIYACIALLDNQKKISYITISYIMVSKKCFHMAHM